MSKTDQVFKWIGVATVVFGVVPFVGVLLMDAPGAVRELKIEMMGNKGGWKQAH